MELYSLVGSWLRIWSWLYLPFQQCTFPTQFLCYSGEQIKFRSSPFPHLCYCSVAKSCLTLDPWTAAHQAPLSFTINLSLLKFMSIESVMLSNHLTLCCPFSFYLQSFPASGPPHLYQSILQSGISDRL